MELDDFLNPKKESRSRALARCQAILAKPPQKEWRRKAFWAEKSLKPFEEELIQRLQKQNWVTPLFLIWDVKNGDRSSRDFPAGDERNLATIVEMQKTLIAYALNDDDPYGRGHLKSPKARRPLTAPYTSRFLRAMACLIKAELSSAKSFRSCWKSHSRGGAETQRIPTLPRLDGEKLTAQASARMLIAIADAQMPYEGVEDRQLLAIKRYAKEALEEFQLTLKELRALAEP